MRLLVFSDIHLDKRACADLVPRSTRCEVIVGAGDFATRHEGLEGTIEALAPIAAPAVLIPGNNETPEALHAACEAHWPHAKSLHAESATVGGYRILGFGAGVPPTGKDWSFDLDEEEAEDLLAEAIDRLGPAEAGEPLVDVFVTHSPPKGFCDEVARGMHSGSTAVRVAVERLRPRVVVCGHVHNAWRTYAWLGRSLVYNAGPLGAYLDVQADSIVIQRPHKGWEQGVPTGTGETSWLDDIVVVKIPPA